MLTAAAYSSSIQQQHTAAAHRSSIPQQHTAAAHRSRILQQHTAAAHRSSVPQQHTAAAHRSSIQQQRTAAAHRGPSPVALAVLRAASRCGGPTGGRGCGRRHHHGGRLHRATRRHGRRSLPWPVCVCLGRREAAAAPRPGAARLPDGAVRCTSVAVRAKARGQGRRP